MYTKEQIHQAFVERHSLYVQQLLYKGNVAIVGLGGLGSNVAVALTRMGVGHIHIIDFDIVDITNYSYQCPFYK